jgi:ATP-dependent RNA helicase DeaD
MQTYGRYIKNFHVLPIYGGQSMSIQLRALQRHPQVIVGTPGRILDHIRRGKLVLEDLKSLVLDEADEMLRMGFIDDVETILQETPEQRQVALFSATMPKPIHRVAQRYLTDPVEVHIKAKTSTVDTITQRYWQVSGLHKLDALTRILEVEDFDGMIIFVRTKNSTVDLAEKLEARGYAASALNGDMNQALREKTIEKMKAGKIDILVATDVAARGLDIDRMSHVVNYDIPYDTESYVHRIGRTGRAGREGQAILFVAPREKRMLGAIERATKQTIERMHLPSSEDIADRRVIAFKQNLTETIESEKLDFFKDLMVQYLEEHDADPIEMAAALAFQVQKTRPLVPQVKHSEKRNADRGPREERRPASDRPRRERPSRHEAEEGMITYRVEVGSNDDVMPKNLVGAIANEAGVESQFIGRITINEDHSLIDLPDGMPKDIFQHLRKVWVNQKQLQISLASDEAAPAGDNSDKPRRRRPRAPEAPRRRPSAKRGNSDRRSKPAGRKPGKRR